MQADVIGRQLVGPRDGILVRESLAQHSHAHDMARRRSVESDAGERARASSTGCQRFRRVVLMGRELITSAQVTKARSPKSFFPLVCQNSLFSCAERRFRLLGRCIDVLCGHAGSRPAEGGFVKTG